MSSTHGVVPLDPIRRNTSTPTLEVKVKRVLKAQPGVFSSPEVLEEL